MRFSAIAAALFCAITTVPGDATARAQDPPSPELRPAGEPRVVRISAERFAFTPSEIKLQVGDVVELRLKSDDTIHGFRILGTETQVAIPKRGGGDVSVIFKAEAAGRYAFECNRMCGAGHHFMRGVIIVRDRAGSAAQ